MFLILPTSPQKNPFTLAGLLAEMNGQHAAALIISQP